MAVLYAYRRDTACDGDVTQKTKKMSYKTATVEKNPDYRKLYMQVSGQDTYDAVNMNGMELLEYSIFRRVAGVA